MLSRWVMTLVAALTVNGVMNVAATVSVAAPLIGR